MTTKKRVQPGLGRFGSGEGDGGGGGGGGGGSEGGDGGEGGGGLGGGGLGGGGGLCGGKAQGVKQFADVEASSAAWHLTVLLRRLPKNEKDKVISHVPSFSTHCSSSSSTVSRVLHPGSRTMSLGPPEPCPKP